MAEVIFESIADYLGTCQGLDAKISALETIIEQLLVTSAKAAERGHLDEYWFDDGHVKIRTKYRSVADVARAITEYDKLLQMYINRRTGRMVRRMDSSNFTGRRW